MRIRNKLILAILSTILVAPTCFAQEISAESLLTSAKDLAKTIDQQTEKDDVLNLNTNLIKPVANEVSKQIDNLTQSEEGQKIIQAVNEGVQPLVKEEVKTQTTQTTQPQQTSSTTQTQPKIEIISSNKPVQVQPIKTDLTNSPLNTADSSIKYQCQYSYPNTTATLLYVTENTDGANLDEFATSYKKRLAKAYFAGNTTSIASCKNSSYKTNNIILKYIYQGVEYTYTIFTSNNIAHVYIYSATDGNLTSETLANTMLADIKF